MESERPDPDQLLRQVQEETKARGKLKIFFGACAGAGKTYAMLLDAQEKLKEGLNVVGGIIETHGRTETYKLLNGIPLLPLRHIEYQGFTLKEFDLDVALKKSPAILLIDELAHTNAAGSRHPKRWQDVEEVLESGIDVYTTLNVQHLESLNDTVANLTGVRVKETVPDSIFDTADEIILVDISSEVILERLQEGKVYLGEFAKQRAAQHFFKMENLIALREIALRRTAERVDALRDIYQKYQHGKSLLSDKILVCIGPKNSSTKLVRKAKQQAIRLKCPWTVLYVESSKYYRLSKEEQMFIEKTLRLAEQLGAKTRVLQESQPAEAIINYAEKNQFTRIIIGSPSKSKWKKDLFGSLAQDIIDKCNTLDVYIIPDEPNTVKNSHQFDFNIPWIGYLITCFIIAICTLFGFPFKEWLKPENVVMIYLAGVVIVSACFEKSAAVLAALLSVLSYKIFFTSQEFSPNFNVYHIRDLVTAAVLLITGLLISNLTSRLRLQNLYARRREKYTADLYEFGRKLIVTPGKHKIAKVVANHIGETFDSAVTVWLPDNTSYLELASHPGIVAELKEESVAQWAYSHNQAAGLGTDTMPSARGYYLPLSNGEKVFGVLGIIPKDLNKTFSSEENMMLEALAIQAALALERVETVDKHKEIKGK